MAAYTLLSSVWDDREKVKSDLLLVADRVQMRYFEYHRPNMQKDYDGVEQSIIWDVFDEQDYRQYTKQYAHLEPEERNPYITILPDGRKLFHLATTDDTNDHRIIYEFTKEYLRMYPDRVIYENWSETLITLSDIERVESEGGYRPDWY